MNRIVEIYELLRSHFGLQHWWPADTSFEVMVGAILVQNTNWGNVEKAIGNLRDAGVLDYPSLVAMSPDEIAYFIRPSGYYNIKAQRLKNLLTMIADKYSGELDQFFQDDPDSLRMNLLGVKGVGFETADSILLYACNQPVFVVDAYTHRVLSRHNLVEDEVDYETMQSLFVDNLPSDVELYNEYHALLVKTAATYCKKNNPLCGQCPLQGVGE